MPKDSLKDKFGFDRVVLDILINTLNTLIKQAERGLVEHPNVGICANWHDLLPNRYQEIKTPGMGYTDVAYRLVAVLSADWPGSKTPGERNNYPVPHDDCYRLWEGPNLAARLSLMRHIYKHLWGWRRRTPA